MIPGHSQEILGHRTYKKIGDLFLGKGIIPIPAIIQWKRSGDLETFKGYVEEFKDQFRVKRSDEVYLLGFSLGAMIAFLTAPRINPRVLLLGSLSPFFREDWMQMKDSWRKNWKKDYKGSDYSFTSYAKKIRSKTLIFVGDQEGEIAINRAKQAGNLIKRSKLIIVKNGKHNIGQRAYLSAVKKEIGRL